MNVNCAYFRNLGWAQLSGKWAPAVLITFVYLLIAIVVSTAIGEVPKIGSLLTWIVTIALFPMDYAYKVAFLDNLRSGKEVEVKNLFAGYKDWGRIVSAMLLSNIFIFLWTLLLIVPGIIKCIEYSQVVYILKDNPQLGPDAAIERSIAMMYGHKWQYFKLVLSFIGWVLLVILTFGIAALFYTPYFCATAANYYEYVKEDYNKRIEA